VRSVNAKRWIDEGWASLVPQLPAEHRDDARELPALLDLAPRGTPWSEVFGHLVTLAAPALVAEALPAASEETMQSAVLAHLLGVIEAFGTDRIADGQLASVGKLPRLLDALREARDGVLEGLAPGGAAEGRAADETAAAAIAEEHAWLARGAPATLADYERVSLGKQAPGFPATELLGRHTGASLRVRRALRGALVGVWMGLQAHDDVVDWEDDFARGGAWVVALARGSGAEVPRDLASARAAVLATHTPAKLLGYARRKLRATRRLAGALGAEPLARWAAEREAKLTALWEREQRAPGATVRAHQLSPWWGEVGR
jgi:hypothetical protein